MDRSKLVALMIGAFAGVSISWVSAIARRQSGDRVATSHEIPVGDGVSAPTPSLDRCCAYPDGECAPDPHLWEGDVWASLNFEITESDAWSYQFEAQGAGFVARAIGDPECDGTYEVIEVRGQVDADGNVVQEVIQ